MFQSQGQQEPWARLDCLGSQLPPIYLVGPKSFFGRLRLRPGQEGFVFPESFAQHGVSSKHFEIHRVPNEPVPVAYVVNLSISGGVHVKHQHKKLGDFFREQGVSQFLRDGDLIGIGSKFYFRFSYINNPANLAMFPVELTTAFILGETFTRGGQGSVKRVYDANPFHWDFRRRMNAMKVISKTRQSNENTQDHVKSLEHLDQEIDNMRNLCDGQHINVVQLFQSFTTPYHNFLIMEFCDSDLLKVITSSEQGKLSEFDTKLIFYQVCRGLRFMHWHRIAHRDIKPENIFMTSKRITCESGTPKVLWIAKIGDFGFSKSVDEDLTTQLGTDCYMPVEVMEGGVYGLSADIWCLGCLLYVMLSGLFPFHNLHPDLNIPQQIAKAEVSFRYRQWKNVTEIPKLLIKNMIQRDPNCRPIVNAIMNHEWFTDDNRLEGEIDQIYRNFPGSV